MRLNKISIGAIALSLLVTGCSDQDSTSQEADGSNSSLENFEPRPPDSPILGNVSDNGQCDPQIVSMDKEKIRRILCTKGNLVMP
jgi:lipoprotein